MPRSTKANLPWIDAVGAKVAAGLSERQARPMIYRQSGPYNQSKKPHVGIFFNDPILHHIAPVKPGHKVDFRFGFYLERCFSPDIDAHVILAGFVMLNPTLSTRFLIPNIRSDGAMIAGKLMAWLRGHEADGGYVSLGVGEGEKYLIRGDDQPEVLADALGAYVSPLRKEGSSPWKRLHFSSISHLPNFKGWEEADLIGGSGDLAAAALGSFKRLDFLYSMLFPRDLGPSRMSGGQNRALKARQPDRRCSWACGDHCEGVVDAAHIKPDRLGGHAVPGNLLWLCRFHHKLLDSHLEAALSLDRASMRVVASVMSVPPPRGKAGGVPLAIWESIKGKGAWSLPLRADSIGHLFD